MSWFLDLGIGYAGVAAILTLFFYALFTPASRWQEGMEPRKMERAAARRLSVGARDRAWR